MNNAEFKLLLEKRLAIIKSTLSAKGDEYADESGDRLSNFKSTGRMKNESPEKALQGMWAKQLTSIFDIIDLIDKEDAKLRHFFVIRPFRKLRERITKKLLDEKIGDAINYLILLEALIKERYEYD